MDSVVSIARRPVRIWISVCVGWKLRPPWFDIGRTSGRRTFNFQIDSAHPGSLAMPPCWDSRGYRNPVRIVMSSTARIQFGSWLIWMSYATSANVRGIAVIGNL